ncbi:alpha/beta hydrolase family esterase [Streptomyces sp. NPDC002144]
MSRYADTERRTIHHDGMDRTYALHLPPELDQTGRRVPVLVELHGSGSHPEQQFRVSGLHRVAEELGLVHVLPQAAIPLTLFPGWEPGYAWNVPGVPLPHADGAGQPHSADDMSFIGALLDELDRLLPLDRRRIYLAGYSGGGRLCSHLLYAREGFAAAGIVAGLRRPRGAAGRAHPRDDRPHRLPSIVAFHGTADPVNPFKGGPDARWDAGVLETAAAIAADADAEPLPRRYRVSDGARLVRYVDPSGHPLVDQYVLEGGVHTWPGSHDDEHARLFGGISREIDASAIMSRLFGTTALGNQN